MSRLELVWLLLAANALAALVYILVFARRGTHAALSAAIMLLCPIVGPVMLALSYLVQRLLLGQNVVDLEAVSFSHEKKVFIFAPDESEHELVPIEESLLISSHAERRKAFLGSMRLNVSRNLALYSLGLENDDSETSHYSASIVMEATAGFQDTLQAMAVEYERTPGDVELTLAYAQAVAEYLDSGILTGIERRRYEELYAFLLDGLRERSPQALDIGLYERMGQNLLDLGELPRAQEWAREAIERFPDEEVAYLGLMQVYYVMGDAAALREAVGLLERSYVAMSRGGVAAVRFFTGAPEGGPASDAFAERG